jgi:hypothetical protein
LTVKEFERQRRVLDQSLTSHRFLSERLRRRKQQLTLSIIALSIAATGFAFASDRHHIDLLARASLPTWAGVISAFVFLLALTDLQTRWDAKAARHEAAAHRLAVLKGQFRSAQVVGHAIQTGGIDLEAEYWSVMNTIEPIPDALFLTLKARHLRKIAESRLASSTVGAPVWLLRWRVRWDGIGALLRRRLGTQAETEPAAPSFLADESGSPDAPGPQQLPREAHGQGRGSTPSPSGPDDGRDDVETGER